MYNPLTKTSATAPFAPEPPATASNASRRCRNFLQS